MGLLEASTGGERSISEFKLVNSDSIIINIIISIMQPMELEFPRSESKELDRGWVLVYGRRKVGKTFMLKTFMRSDLYILVGSEGRMWVDGEPSTRLDSVEDLTDLVMSRLEAGGTVVLDEFQRIPLGYLERICSVHPKGRLLLSGSSMGVVAKVLGPGSPLLGRFFEVRLGLIKPCDLFGSYPRGLPLDYAPYISDPWTIPALRGKGIIEDLYMLMSGTVYTVPSLLGEVFHAEERNLSEVYRGILGAIGSGRSKPSEIASLLYGRGVISKDSASHISPYIANMRTMGLLKEVGLYGMKRPLYRLGSPIFSVYHYMQSKYGLERGLPRLEEVRENLVRIHNLCMEAYLVEVLADHLGGYVQYSFDPEIDGIIVDRKDRPVAVVEVKWGRAAKRDIDGFVEKTSHINADRYLISKYPVKRDDMKVLTRGGIKGLYKG